MIKNSSSQDNGHSESSKVAPENTLRERLEAIYNASRRMAMLRMGSPMTYMVDEAMQAFTAAMETVIGEDDTVDNHGGMVDLKLLKYCNKLRAIQRQRLAEMVSKTKEGENI